MKYVIFVLALFFSTQFFAQFDNEAYDFKRNSIRFAVGSQSSSAFPVQYRNLGNGFSPGSKDFEIEYERQISRHFSASLLYKFIDYDLTRYVYKEHQRQLNLFYAPFNNLRRLQFKIGAGMTHSIIKQIRPESWSALGFSSIRTTEFDWGLIGIVELNYEILNNISIGVKGFQQLTYWNKTPYGGVVKLGYSF